MYLLLDGSKVLKISKTKIDGYIYTSKALKPPRLKDNEVAYIYYNIDKDEFNFEIKKGEI